LKKIPETDEIFENVHRINKESDENPNSLRFSMDAKAKVHVWNLDRRWKARRKDPLIADDHDTNILAKLIPYWITKVCTWEVGFYYWKSNETSDFVVDCLDKHLTEALKKEPNITEVVLNIDNWPDQRSNRTQFIKRIVELSMKHNISIHLAYYPPYYSKYNYIEHVFWALERFWNWTILNTIDTVLEWTKNMIWKNKNPITVELIDKDYEKWITVSKNDMIPFLKHIIKHKKLYKRDVYISPVPIV